MKIYDTVGGERDWAWLLSTFGQGVRVDARPIGGEPGYEAVELRAKEGPCAIVVRVLDKDGTLLPSVPVARWWDDGSLPALPADLATWKTQGIFGTTNAEGNIGFGMGHGDGYDPNSGNLPVSEVWCGGNSGRVHGLGWVWDTNHLHLDVTFRYVEGAEEPPGEPGTCDVRLAAIEDELAALATELDDIKAMVVEKLDAVLVELRRMS